MNNSEISGEEHGILNQRAFKIMFHLNLFSEELLELKVVPDYLQKSDFGAPQVCFLINSSIDKWQTFIRKISSKL